jgi:uncharacterized protein involved in exopolysaccharide biosynthesis
VDQSALTFHDYLDILKRRKWQLIVPTLLLVAIAVAVALALPPVYRSTATILIEEQAISPDLIRSTVSSFAAERIQLISQQVMTSRNLSEIISKFGLYSEDVEDSASTAAVVRRVRENIGLQMISEDVVNPQSGREEKATLAFMLSFEHPDPEIAQQVTDELVSLFLAENERERQEAVAETSNFLRDEATKLEERIEELESALANFKEQHGDNLPELLPMNREFIARTQKQLEDNARNIRMLREQRVYLEAELSGLEPKLSPDGKVSPESRLLELEALYAGAAARYSSTHPDRIQLEREIAGLRKIVARSGALELQRELAETESELAFARERYSEKHPDVRRLKRNVDTLKKQIGQAITRSGSTGDYPGQLTDNPAYVKLESQLEANKLETEALEETQQELEEKLADYEKRIAEAPLIERQYNALIREYETALTKHGEVVAKQLGAELAKAVESERKGERLTVIEPASLPDTPVKPNRPIILLAGVMLSVAGGVGNVAVRELMDATIRGARAIQAITNAPPLAVIPAIASAPLRNRRKRLVFVVLLLLIAAMAIVVAARLEPLAAWQWPWETGSSSTAEPAGAGRVATP